MGIVDYDIIQADEASGLRPTVKNWIDQGWQPLGAAQE
jgi:hypothetical protein